MDRGSKRDEKDRAPVVLGRKNQNPPGEFACGGNDMASDDRAADPARATISRGHADGEFGMGV